MEAVVNFPQQSCFRGSVVKEYLLIARLQPGVWQEVEQEKRQLAGRWNGMEPPGDHPGLVLATFLAKEEMEDTLLRWMHRLLQKQPGFSVTLNNYGGTPGGRAIHLRVQETTVFRKLAGELKVIDELVQSNGLPAARLIAQPKLVLGTAPESASYRKIMMEYSRKEFHASSMVQELVLLKRTGPFDPCRQVNIFRLQP